MSPAAAGAWRALRIAGVNLAVLALALALLEAAVRVRAVWKYGFAGGVEDVLAVDERLGLRVPVAGAQLGPIRINRLGFRGPEIAVPKPPGTVRLAFLGGSTTFCAEVSGNEATWPHLAWRRLQEAFPERRFDYVNGGVPGYSLDASLANLRERVAPLQPDVIVIYHASNDLSGNSFALAREQGLIEERPDRQRSWLARRSLLVYLAEVNLNVLANQRAAAGAAPRLEPDLARLTQPFDADLAALLAAAKAVAPVVAVATFATQFRPGQPAQRQLEAAASSLYYMPYMSMPGLLDAFAAYNDVIRARARADGVLLIEAAGAIPGDPVHFRDAIHFTDAGSAAMAAAVAGRLLEALRDGPFPEASASAPPPPTTQEEPP